MFADDVNVFVSDRSLGDTTALIIDSLKENRCLINTDFDGAEILRPVWRIHCMMLNVELRLEEQDTTAVERQLVQARLPNSRQLVRSPRCA